MLGGMKAPLYVRPLTRKEQQHLKAGLRSSNGFTVRRCQMLLASARGEGVKQIAGTLACARQSVRNAIRDFHRRGLACLHARSSRPRSVQPLFDQARCDALRALLHESPRSCGKPRSTWTLELAAEVCWEHGLTTRRVSLETLRQALARLGVSWRRAKHWITSPDPQYALKKSSATA
jgi:transposase